MTVPRVSVLMPVHNGQPFVAAAVQSILQQSYGSFELIVIDDGSTDDTHTVIERFGDPRVVMFRQENQGLTRSLITAAARARGEFLARQDADDVSEKRRLETQVKFLDDNPDTGLVGAQARLIDEAGEELGCRSLELAPALDVGRLVSENQFVHGSIMMRASMYATAGGYREYFRYAQDYDLILRMANCAKVANLSAVLYRHRMRADELSIVFNAQQEYYRDTAKTLHHERMNGGADSLDCGRISAPQFAGQSSVSSEVVQKRYRERYIYTCLRSGKLYLARREVRESIRLHPTQIKTYLQFVMTYLGGRQVAYLLRLWDSVRGVDSG